MTLQKIELLRKEIKELSAELEHLENEAGLFYYDYSVTANVTGGKPLASYFHSALLSRIEEDVLHLIRTLISRNNTTFLITAKQDIAKEIEDTISAVQDKRGFKRTNLHLERSSRFKKTKNFDRNIEDTKQHNAHNYMYYFPGFSAWV